MKLNEGSNAVTGADQAFVGQDLAKLAPTTTFAADRAPDQARYADQGGSDARQRPDTSASIGRAAYPTSRVRSCTACCEALSRPPHWQAALRMAAAAAGGGSDEPSIWLRVLPDAAFVRVPLRSATGRPVQHDTDLRGRVGAALRLSGAHTGCMQFALCAPPGGVPSRDAAQLAAFLPSGAGPGAPFAAPDSRLERGAFVVARAVPGRSWLGAVGGAVDGALDSLFGAGGAGETAARFRSPGDPLPPGLETYAYPEPEPEPEAGTGPGTSPAEALPELPRAPGVPRDLRERHPKRD
ncbi:hypothetical protein DFJ74DRAFT_763619 [Hyaloraphidium curvatum]|nr:hypothetical protein DFJ74DRAFT_763619 [Hyaloraphidium curvatum]